MDHPELAGMPEVRPPTKWSMKWYAMEADRYTKLSAQHQGLTPPSVAAFLLGVSRQRVHELIKFGRLTEYEICERKWLPVDQVEAFARLERDSGFRYGNAPTVA